MSDESVAALNGLTESLQEVHATFNQQNSLNEQSRQQMLGDSETKRNELQAQTDAFQASAAANIAATMDARGGLVPFMTTGGQVSWFFGISKMLIEELRPDGSLGTGTHPAFIMNDGKEAGMLWYAAYPLSFKNGEVVSQPNSQPYTSRTLDEENALCASTAIAGVEGHRNSSIWDNALLSLIIENLSQNGGQEPIGNTAYGKSHLNPSVKGHGTSWTKTGTMGAAANHNREAHGIADVNGNVWTRCSGMHLQDGEIFLAANNDPLMIDNPVSTGYYFTSSNTDGNGAPSLVDSASAVTRNGGVGSDEHANYDYIGGASGFASLTGASSALLRLAGLAPHGDGTDLSGAVWVRNYGRRTPLLRGGWGDGSNAGSRALHLNRAPSFRSSNIGFRSAFVTGVS